jgi:intracellular septation protein
MKFLFDLFPVIFFFITLKISEKWQASGVFLGKLLGFLGISTTVKPDLVPIMLATVVVILATFLQVAWVKLRHGKVDKMLWISFILIILLGGMTLYFQNATFIKWKATILDWVIAAALLTSEVFWHKNLIRSMMEQQLSLPEAVWKQLNLAWVIFFASLGALSLYIAFNFSIDTWASFKLFGTMGLMFIFVIAQSLFLNKYMTESDAD